jgi:hypothetical protein
LTGSKKVYISGAQYTGVFGQDPTLSAQSIFANVISSDIMTTGTMSANVVNATTVTAQTITTNTINANVINAYAMTLETPLGANSGGTGLKEFTPFGVLYASNTSALTFATGSSGQLLQIDITGTPVFEDLNGGEYT